MGDKVPHILAHASMKTKRSIMTTRRAHGPGAGQPDWIALAALAGLDPGKKTRGWVAITCPSCGARGKANADVAMGADSGGISCKKCGHTGHVTHHLDLDQRPARTLRDPADEYIEPPPDAKVIHIDISKVDAELKAHTALPDAQAYVRAWARKRGWPKEVCDAVARDQGAWRVVPTRFDGLGDDARAYIEGQSKRSLADHRLWIPFRAADAAVVGYQRRASKPLGPKTPKSATASLSLYTPWASGHTRLFGSIPEAIEAAACGERIYIVEGEADWLAARAVVRLKKLGGVVLGSQGGTAARVAKALRDRLIARGLYARVVIVPDIGDSDQNGLKKAQRAADALLGLKAGVQAKAPRADVILSAPRFLKAGKGDFSDDLTRGGIEAAAAVLDVEPPPHMLSPEAGRERLGERLGALSARLQKGERVVATVVATPGLGKTRAALETVIAPMVRAGRRVVLTLPTRDTAQEKYRDLAQLLGTQALLRLGMSAAECSMLDIRKMANDAAPGGGGAFCHLCPMARGCAGKARSVRERLEMKSLEGKGVVIVTTAAKGFGGRKEDGTRRAPAWVESADLVVVDEDVLDQHTRTVTLSAAVVRAAAEGGLCEGLDPVLGLMGRGTPFDGPALRAACPQDSVGANAASSDFSAARWAEDPQGEAEKVTVPWWVPPMIEQAAASEWRGCHGDAQGLTLTCPSPLPLGRQGGIFLDATMTKGLAQAVAPGSEWIEITARCAPSTRLRLVAGPKMGASKSAVRGEMKKRVEVIAHHLDSPDALHAVCKDTAQTPAFQALAGSVLHFEGTEARGSNAHENARRVVAHAYFAPARVVRACAEIIGGIEPSEEAQDEADFITNAAPVVQLAFRARPAAGGVDVWMMTGEKIIPGLVPDETISLSRLAFDAGCDGRLEHRHDLRPGGLAKAAWDALEGGRNAVIVGRIKKAQGDQHNTVCIYKGIALKTLRFFSEEGQQDPSRAKKVLGALLHRHGAEKVAGWAGCYYSAIATDIGQISVLHSGVLRREDVAGFLNATQSKARSFRWRGRNVKRSVATTAPEVDVVATLKGAAAELWSTLGKRPRVGEVIRRAGVKKDTARRHAQKSGFKDVKTLILSAQPPQATAPPVQPEEEVAVPVFVEGLMTLPDLRDRARSGDALRCPRFGLDLPIKWPSPASAEVVKTSGDDFLAEVVKTAEDEVFAEALRRVLAARKTVEHATAEDLQALAFDLTPDEAAALDEFTDLEGPRPLWGEVLLTIYIAGKNREDAAPTPPPPPHTYEDCAALCAPDPALIRRMRRVPALQAIVEALPPSPTLLDLSEAVVRLGGLEGAVQVMDLLAMGTAPPIPTTAPTRRRRAPAPHRRRARQGVS